MNSPVIMLHTLIPTINHEEFPSLDLIHNEVDYQITSEGDIYKKNKEHEESSHPSDCSTMIYIGFQCKARGGSLTKAQYHAGLSLILDLFSQKTISIPPFHNSIACHHDMNADHQCSCPGPFFPWARLRNDLGHNIPSFRSINTEELPFIFTI